MQMLNRRVTSGTHLKLRVPEWHVFGIKRAKTPQIWHTFVDKNEKHACQMWHTFYLEGVFFGKLHTSYNTMIKHQFQCCNHRCEVCENKNHRKTHTNTSGVHHHIIFLDRNYFFFKEVDKFPALKFRQTLTKTLDN